MKFCTKKSHTYLSLKTVSHIRQSQKGSVSSIGLVLTLFIMAITLTGLGKSLEELNHIKFRTRSYLCSKSLLKEVKPYVKFMTGINSLIKVAYPMQFVPIPKVSKFATTAIKYSIYVQNTYHAFYLAKVLANPKCKKETKLSFLLKSPSEIKNLLKLKRNKNKTVIMREKWRDTLVFKAPKHLSLFKHSFALVINYKIEEEVSTKKVKINSKEINSVALQKLKQLAGL